MEAIHNEFTKSFISNNVNVGLFCMGELYQSEGYEYALSSFLYRILMYVIVKNPEMLCIIIEAFTNKVEIEKIVKYCLMHSNTDLSMPVMMVQNKSNRIVGLNVKKIEPKMKKARIIDIITYLLRSKNNMKYLDKVREKMLDDGIYTDYIQSFERFIEKEITNKYHLKKLRVLFFSNMLYIYSENHKMKKKVSVSMDDLTHEEMLNYKHKKPSIFKRRLHSLNLCVFANNNIAIRDMGEFHNNRLTNYWKKQKNIFKKINKDLGEDFEERWSIEEKYKSNQAKYKSYREVLYKMVERKITRKSELKKRKELREKLFNYQIVDSGKKGNVTPFYDVISQQI